MDAEKLIYELGNLLAHEKEADRGYDDVIESAIAALKAQGEIGAWRIDCGGGLIKLCVTEGDADTFIGQHLSNDEYTLKPLYTHPPASRARELVWSLDRESSDRWKEWSSDVGGYEIEQRPDGLCIWYDRDRYASPWMTFDEAKAAAQADHQHRFDEAYARDE